jgi:hypothetical protein
MNHKLTRYSVTAIAGTLVFAIVVETSLAHNALHPEEPLRQPIFPEKSRVTSPTTVSSTSNTLTFEDISVAIDALKKGYYGRF